jgi:hypothetical protein
LANEIGFLFHTSTRLDRNDLLKVEMHEFEASPWIKDYLPSQSRLLREDNSVTFPGKVLGRILVV